MASKGCKVTYNNKEYSYDEFSAALHNGLLNKLIEDGDISEDKLTGDKSVLPNMEGMTERGFATRTKDAPDFELISKETEFNPELLYNPQNMAESKEKVMDMSDEELIANMNEVEQLAEMQSGSNLGVLVLLDKLSRAIATGDSKTATALYEVAAKAGTTLGQLMRQLGELKISSPDAIVFFLDKTLEKLDLKLTDSDRAKIMALAEKAIKTRVAYNDARIKAKNDFSRENLRAMKDAGLLAEDAYIQLQNRVNSTVPKNMWGLYGTIMQGNLLTPLSQATNVWANILFSGVRGSYKAVGAGVDRAIRLFSKNYKPETVIDPEVKKYYYQGLVRGLKEAARQVRTGVDLSNLEKYEMQRGFQPMRSLIQFWSGEGMPVNSKGKVEVNERFKKLIEGVFGMPAEAMFRLLSLGDKPFSRANEMEQLARIGKSKGLTGEKLKQFVMFPDYKSAATAQQEALKSTFQQDSKTANLVNQFLKPSDEKSIMAKYISNPLKFLLRTQMPYVKTPLNIITETMDFVVPILPLGKAIDAYKRGDRREATINFGKAAVGAMIASVAYMLVKEGIVSGTGAGEEKKERELKNGLMPNNSINVSALNRFINGESTELRADDDIISLDKMGIIGSVFGVYANTVKTLTKTEDASQAFYQTLLYAIPASASVMLEQSFLKGTSTLIDAIGTGNYDRWLESTFNAITSIPLPNTLSAINRAKREYMPSLTGDSIGERLSNVIKNKMFMTDDLPVKYNLWGEPITQTPTGSNPWLYNLLDVTKSKTITGNKESIYIYNLYKETEDASVIPDIPKRKFSYNGVTIDKLTDKQYQELIKMTGKQRLIELRDVISASDFDSQTTEDKIALIEGAYSLGATIAKQDFAEKNNIN